MWTFEVIRPRHSETPETLAELTRSVARQWGLWAAAPRQVAPLANV